jgi:hypothetical protein
VIRCDGGPRVDLCRAEPVEWAIEYGLFAPKKPHERSPEFIGGFTTASQPHHHYRDGKRVA